jgi:hypothetical protein
MPSSLPLVFGQEPVFKKGFGHDECLHGSAGSNRICDRGLFLYDHLHRKEARSGLRCYPLNILAIHEEYTTSLRKQVQMDVDICWGKVVKERMTRTLDLEALKLCGKYDGVTLWIE